MINQNNQTNKNLVYNIVNLLFTIVIAIFYIPYLVQTLGILAYGIVPLALLVNQYIRVLTVSLTNSLTRFYSLAIQQINPNLASQYLSSAIIAITIFLIFLTPVLIWIIVKIENIFNIPDEYIYDAKLLFSFIFLGFFLSLYSSIINITLYANNRLDSLNVIGISRLILKVLITVCFFEILSGNVSYIGYASFASEFFVLVLSVLYYKKNIDLNVKISFKNFNKIVLLSMLSMSIWVVVQQLGDTAMYRTDNFLVNKFWGTRESGILGAITELGNYIMVIVSVISSLFGPLILIAYSKGDHRKVQELSIRSSLWVGLTSSLIVGVLVGFSQPLLEFWIGEKYGLYSDWLIFKIISIPFYASAGIFSFVFRAWNKIFFPAVITLMIGLINLFISYLILSFSNQNEIYIKYMLIVSLLFTIIQSYGLSSFWYLKLYPKLKKTIFIAFLKILIALLLASLFSECYNRFVKIDNLFDLAIGLILVAILTMPILFYTLISTIDRKIIINYFLKHINKNVIKC